MDEILKEVKELRYEVNLLREEVQTISKTNKKMDTHINFVEGVYSSVRTPTEYLLNSVNRWMGGPSHTTELPAIEESPDEESPV